MLTPAKATLVMLLILFAGFVFVLVGGEEVKHWRAQEKIFEKGTLTV